MTKRLNIIFHLIPREGRGVIDVGTDHGLIPIALAESSYQGNIIATDIHISPLETARRAADSKKVKDKIHFLQADGLELCPPDAVDCIIVAGMGGDTICSILDRAEWLYTFPYRLIMQPMTRPEVLRYWLLHNEFMIDQEIAVCEDNNIYQVFSAVAGKSAHYTDAEYLTGKAERHKDQIAMHQLICQQISQVRKKLKGLECSKISDGISASFYADILHELERMYNEYKGF